MSDDLISRKALLEEMALNPVIPILEINMREEHKAILKIREIIMNMPAVYEKEKLIESIKTIAAGYVLNYNYPSEYVQGCIDMSKEIIKNIGNGVLK